jgi:hypothetical protein
MGAESVKPLLAVIRNVVVGANDHVNHLSAFRLDKRKTPSVIPPHVGGMIGLLFLSAGGLLATTIVGIWTPDLVTIVADSKLTDYHVGGATVFRTGCKVFVIRDVVVALSGIFEAEGISVVNALKASTPFTVDGKPDDAAGFIIAGKVALQRVMVNRNAESFQLPPGTVYVSMIVAGNTSGVPVMTRVTMRQSNSGIVESWVAFPEMADLYRGATPQRAIEIIGRSTAIVRFQNSQPARWSSGSDLEVGKRLIAIEASDPEGSRFTGPPISIITIRKGGLRPEWLEKGACQ